MGTFSSSCRRTLWPRREVAQNLHKPRRIPNGPSKFRQRRPRRPQASSRRAPEPFDLSAPLLCDRFVGNLWPSLNAVRHGRPHVPVRTPCVICVRATCSYAFLRGLHQFGDECHLPQCFSRAKNRIAERASYPAGGSTVSDGRRAKVAASRPGRCFVMGEADRRTTARKTGMRAFPTTAVPQEPCFADDPYRR